MTDYRDDLLKLILDKVTIKDGVLTPTNHVNLLKTQRFGIVLISELLEGEHYQEKFDAIQYAWFANSLHPLFFEPFQTAITELKIENKHSFQDFKKKVDRELKKIEHEKLVSFDFLYPIRIQPVKNLKKMEIEGISVEIKTYDEVETFLSDSRLLDEIREYEMNYTPHQNLPSRYYIHVSLSARNLWYAERKAARNAQLIVSIIAYIENYRVMARTLIGPPKSISDLDIEVELAFSEKKFVDLYPKYNAIGKKNHKLGNKQIDDINSIIESFETSDPSVQDFIEDGLIAYYAGTIEKHMGYAFLNFWTSAERFCLKTKKVNEFKIMERLLSPLLNKTGITKSELERLYRIRNKMIHEADYGLATEYDRNIMQFYIEPFIAFFIQKLSKYPKDKIERIFEFLNDPDSDLSKFDEIVDKI
jgi:hypothetical protein